MRLLRLLTAGRSLVGLQDSAGRYHVSGQRLLPKFDPAKNPFRTTTLPKPAATSQPAGRPWYGQCASKLAALLAPAPKPAQPARSRLAKTPVQGELSLDTIKVVRNDLSDSDLEVVPARAPVTPVSPAPALKPVESGGEQGRGGTPLAPEESAEPAGAAWSRVSTRLFGAGKTLT